ncbi:winged helix-turn-helix transcriptional regulator [Methanocella sp. MCL-LM]|uniref:winged helix-turn-helix transcriptional regulator n=1 Tax=Methanocella sp. MCL-LM TaxID=3412035 RepID=UPI003C725009
MKKYVAVGIAIIILLALSFLLLVLWTDGEDAAGREIPGIGTPDYIYTGDDDMLYLFSDRNITALSPDGSFRYRFTLPAGYSIYERWYFHSWWDYVYVRQSGQPIVSSSNGTLYVYLVPAGTETYKDGNEGALTEYYGTGLLLSIGPDGRQEWSLPLDSLMVPARKYQYIDAPLYQEPPRYTIEALSDAYISVSNGTLYVFHGYNESAIDANGTLLWTIGGVSDPAAVDEAGNVYVAGLSSLPGMVTDTQEAIVVWDVDFGKEDYRVPGMIVDSYYPNGTLRWRALTVDLVQRQPGSGPLLQYRNHTIYVPLEDAMMAIGENGSELWKKRFDRKDYLFVPEDSAHYIEEYGRYFETPEGGDFQIYLEMPFDREGNLYLKYATGGQYQIAYYLIVISPGGEELSSRKISGRSFNGYVAVGDGILYATDVWPVPMIPGGPGSTHDPTPDLEDLRTQTLTAYDARTAEPIWNYTIPVDRPETGELSEANFDLFFDEITAQRLKNYSRTRNLTALTGDVVVNGYTYYGGWNTQDQILSILSSSLRSNARAGNGRVYVDFRTLNYENPVYFNTSRYAYVGGVYVIDTNGTLLWRIPVYPTDQVITPGNSTVLYESGDGKVYVKYAGAAAAGITFLSALFLFFKYFLAGTVARARSRLDQNDNRMAVLQFIRENPGLTMYDIARGTGQNRGTVRYHLLILGINHKIVEHRPDGKYVRYFANSGNYSQQERTVISLMKRDVTRKVLCLLHRKPGASNGEISAELDIPESIASRCTKELADRGLIIREPESRGFRVKEEFGGLVGKIAEEP